MMPSSEIMVSSSWGLNGVRPRRPEQSFRPLYGRRNGPSVSMESGLEGRNNRLVNSLTSSVFIGVSMESGLEGRNNRSRVRSGILDDIWSQWSPA